MEATETEGDRRPEDETNQVALGEQKQVIDGEGEITKTGGIIVSFFWSQRWSLNFWEAILCFLGEEKYQSQASVYHKPGLSHYTESQGWHSPFRRKTFLMWVSFKGSSEKYRHGEVCFSNNHQKEKPLSFRKSNLGLNVWHYKKSRLFSSTQKIER